MNGGHDLGGKQGLGPINPEPEQQEPYFHEDWERRVFALTLATGMLGRWNIDESRHARERQHPADYLQHSYYENWLVGIEKLLVEKGLLDPQELQQYLLDPDGHRPDRVTDLRVPDAGAADKIIRSGGPSEMQSDKPAQFAVGDKVLVKKTHTAGHTRAPGYAQGSTGTIVNHWGCHVYPDNNSRGEHSGEHLYSVSFTASALWGSPAENAEVLIDLWEPYLERVGHL